MAHADAELGPALLRLTETDRTIPNPDEDVRGRKVTDSDGEELGKIGDLLVDDTARQVRFLVVQHGGILGIGASEVFIPVDAITDITDDEVFVDTSREKISNAPQYDPEIGTETDFYQDVYGYYGVTPFWAPGYTTPGFPYFGHRGE